MGFPRHHHGEREEREHEREEAGIENQPTFGPPAISCATTRALPASYVLEKPAAMANNIVENLGKELEQIDREYASDFAGHSPPNP